MDEKLRIASRIRNVKESLQEQAEIQLSNAVTNLRQLESRETDLHNLKLNSGGEPGLTTVADLQARMLYGDLLGIRLQEVRDAATAAANEVEQRRQEVQEAYVETNRWITLEDMHQSRVKQETEHHQQQMADELAIMNHFLREEN